MVSCGNKSHPNKNIQFVLTEIEQKLKEINGKYDISTIQLAVQNKIENIILYNFEIVGGEFDYAKEGYLKLVIEEPDIKENKAIYGFSIFECSKIENDWQWNGDPSVKNKKYIINLKKIEKNDSEDDTKEYNSLTWVDPGKKEDFLNIIRPFIVENIKTLKRKCLFNYEGVANKNIKNIDYKPSNTPNDNSDKYNIIEMLHLFESTKHFFKETREIDNSTYDYFFTISNEKNKNEFKLNFIDTKSKPKIYKILNQLKLTIDTNSSKTMKLVESEKTNLFKDINKKYGDLINQNQVTENNKLNYLYLSFYLDTEDNKTIFDIIKKYFEETKSLEFKIKEKDVEKIGFFTLFTLKEENQIVVNYNLQIEGENTSITSLVSTCTITL